MQGKHWLNLQLIYLFDLQFGILFASFFVSTVV